MTFEGITFRWNNFRAQKPSCVKAFVCKNLRGWELSLEEILQAASKPAAERTFSAKHSVGVFRGWGFSYVNTFVRKNIRG